MNTTIGSMSASRIFLGRGLRLAVRDVESLIMGIVLPVMMTVLLTNVFGGAISTREQYLAYVVPGIILVCAGFGAAGTAIAVSSDLSSGSMDRFRTMPITGWTVLVGHAGASVVRNLASTAIVIAVAIGLGYRPAADLTGWLAVSGMVALWIVAITLLFTVVGLFSVSPQAASGYGFLLLFLPYISSAFAPLSTLPGWLQPVATHQPSTPVIETLRAVLNNLPTGDYGWIAAGWCLAISGASIVLLTWAFPRLAVRRR